MVAENNQNNIKIIENIEVKVIDDKHYELLNVREVENKRAKPIIIEIDKNGCWNCISHFPNEKRGGYIWVSNGSNKKQGLHKLVLGRKLGIKISKDLGILTRHTCDNPKCCNPQHLLLGTPLDNTKDMKERKRAFWQKREDYKEYMSQFQKNWADKTTVVNICNDFINGEHNFSKLDKKYKVCRGVASNIIHKKIYTNITKEFDFKKILKEDYEKKEQFFINVLNFSKMGYTIREIADFLNTNRETVRNIINDTWEIKYKDIKNLENKIDTEPFVYISGIEKCSVSNGVGFRTVVFFSFCNIHCEGCQNKTTTWELNSGKKIKIKDLTKILLDLPQDITLSGGECLCQYKGVELLLKELKKANKNIWVYTGRTFEELYEELGFHKKKKYINCLKNIDVLVDGRFEKDKKDLTLPFRGSSNQRVIDVKQTLSTHTLTLYQPN